MKVLALLRSLFRWKRLLWIFGSLVGLYTLFGFLILPRILESQLPKRLSQLLGRPVSVRSVKTNPYALSITIDGFLVRDWDGEPFLGWDRLYVNANASTLFGRSVSFATIHLARPYGRVVLEKGGKLNFSDIVERLNQPSTQPQPKPKPKPKAQSEPLEIAIGHLSIEGAKVSLLDRSIQEPFATTLGPINIELRDFRTEHDSHSPYTFMGRTESGEAFSWTGLFSADPLKSTGSFALQDLVLPKYHPYYRDQVAFDLRDGRLTLKADYAFEWTEGRHLLQLQNGSVDLLRLTLAHQGSPEPAVELPIIAVRGIQADALENTAEVAAVEIRNGKLDVRRLSNGEISLVNLLKPKVHPASGKESSSIPAPESKAKEPSKPLRFTLKELGLSGFQVAFEDQAVSRPTKIRIEDLECSLKDFSLDPAHAATLSTSMKINDGGHLSLNGTLLPFKPSADLALKVDHLDVSDFDAYLDPATDIRLNRGLLTIDATVRAAFEGKNTDSAAFKGNVRLDNFEAMDGAQQEPFLRYKTLKLTGLDVRTRPRVLNLESAELIEHENRMVISQDGTTNVERALKIETKKTPAEDEAPTPSVIANAAVPPTPTESFQVNIGKVLIHGGRLTFIDRSVEPNAALLISDLEGTNTGLTTDLNGKSMLDLKGLAGGTAPITIQGRAMPLRHDKDTDITVKIAGADLTDFSPYGGRYLGYTIREGKLDVDAHIRIQDRKLQIDDKTHLNRLYLGDPVESPHATHLPVKLALALLRDRRGVIELEVPVEGSLDDPDVHYGRMVWHAVLNVLGKAAMAPFTLLSNVFGSGHEDLSHASFQPGSTTLDVQEQKKLATLIKALHERPELMLEVEGTADPLTDATALKRQKLEILLRRTKWNSRKDNPITAPEEEVIDPNERERWMRAAYDAAFPAPKGSKPVPPPIAEVEQRLLGTMIVEEEDLRVLAEARTRAAVTALLKGDQVDAPRIFEVQGSENAKAAGARVYFALK